MPPPNLDDEFVALPVGQGDAFFLRRAEFTALIDGGKSRYSFSELFGKTLGLGHVNVLVCTHNDDDHAKGIIGFLEGALACDEDSAANSKSLGSFFFAPELVQQTARD